MKWQWTVEFGKFNLSKISCTVIRSFASLMLFLCLYKLQLALRNVVHLQHQICRIEILQTSFSTGVLSIHLLHIRRLIFSCLDRIFTFSIVKSKIRFLFFICEKAPAKTYCFIIMIIAHKHLKIFLCLFLKIQIT